MVGHRGTLLVALLVSPVGSACEDRPAAPKEAPTPTRSSAAATVATAPPPSPTAGGDDMPCTVDADCPHLACGPCTPGTHVSRRPMPSCTVNPCKNGSTVCSAEHVCVVAPGTTKNPAVWGSAAPRAD